MPAKMDTRPDYEIAREELSALMVREGLAIALTFVPFSQSRNAKPREDGKPWRSLNWKVTLTHKGREVLTTDYGQGEGHIPNPDKLRANGLIRDRQVTEAIETGKFGRDRFGGSVKIKPPREEEVFSSLLLDSGAVDAGSFEDWASDYGYNTDSRSAEATYRACLDIGLKLRATLGDAVMSEARELGSRF